MVLLGVGSKPIVSVAHSQYLSSEAAGTIAGDIAILEQVKVM